jgi:DNA modification methylase
MPASVPSLHSILQDVVRESKRILKPNGSAVFILQPNYKKIGQMRLWIWEFLLWAARDWNLIQDVYWWSTDSLPTSGANRKHGFLRQSVKMCIWPGPSDCYRNQDDILWKASDGHAARKWTDRALQKRPSGYTVRDGRTAQTSTVRGGTVPFNLLPIPHASDSAAGNHPAATPYELVSWWCRYILPKKGVLLDPFCGSGTVLAAGLDQGASKVIGIDKEKKYLTIAKKRIQRG